MKDISLLKLASIPAIGIIAQWIAIRIKFPSILLLLLSGFLIGPIFKLLHPDVLLGNMLFPFISLSVAIILFEGGLTLRFSDLQQTGKTITYLIFLGGLISWVCISFFAYIFLNLDIRLSVLLGSILLVSGPTVVTPLLRQIKLKHSLASILRWEGIIIDPVGASLAVLIFEVIMAHTAADAIGSALIVLISTLLSGFIIGVLGAILLIIIFKKNLLPDYLQEAFTFIVVLSTYSIADIIQSESGLLVVTIMGIVLANQKIVTIRHIISFKENITVLLISSLFVVLGARVELADLLRALSISTVFFLISLIVFVRPASVFLSTFKSPLTFLEKSFIASLYPRGIVAAAVASLFSIRLSEAGVPNADLLNPITFFTIILTVSFYGLMGRPLVRFFRLQRQQQGIIFVGAHHWSRLFAKALEIANVPILMIDTNLENIISAKEMGLNTKHGSVLSRKIMDELEISSYGKILSLTSSDETNLLASIEYSQIFSKFNIIRLYPKDRKKDLFIKSEQGLFLLGKGMSSTYIQSLVTAGASFKPSTLTEDFTYADFIEKFPKAYVLCMINAKGKLKFFYEGHSFKPVPGCIIISLRK